MAVKSAGRGGEVAVFGTDVSDQMLGFLLAEDQILQAVNRPEALRDRLPGGQSGRRRDPGARSREPRLHAGSPCSNGATSRPSAPTGPGCRNSSPTSREPPSPSRSSSEAPRDPEGISGDRRPQGRPGAVRRGQGARPHRPERRREEHPGPNSGRLHSTYRRPGTCSTANRSS